MSTKKLNYNKEDWNRKWEKEPAGSSWGTLEEKPTRKRTAGKTDSGESSVSAKKSSSSVRASSTAFSGGSSFFEPPSGYDGSGGGTGGDKEPPKKDKKRILTVILITAAVIALFLVTFIVASAVRSCRQKDGLNVLSSAERENTLTLAKRYIERGEYDRAMNLLDQLLIQNADDAEALALSDEILALKAGQKPKDAFSYNNVQVDTSQIEKAVDRLAAENARAARENAKSAAALAEAMKKQEEQKRAEEERLAAQKRAQEQAAQEEAKRKAYERELAKKNAELQKLIARINDEVASGKASVLSGRYDDGLKHFKTADSLLPQDQKEFSGGKLAEIAGLLSSAAQNEPDKDKQTLLKNEAVNYAKKKFGADSRQCAVALRIGKGRRRCKKVSRGAERIYARGAKGRFESFVFL